MGVWEWESLPSTVNRQLLRQQRIDKLIKFLFIHIIMYPCARTIKTRMNFTNHSFFINKDGCREANDLPDFRQGFF